MAIPPLSGSLSPGSLPNEITPVDRADVFETIPIVKDVTTTRNAFISEDYPRTAALIQGYVEGSVLTVTYYHVIGSQRGRQSITDITALRDNLDIPLMKISQFEMKVPTGFTLSWDGEAAESTVAGEAIVYPGFSPKIGDVFICTLSSSQIGAFSINQVEPLSYYNERLHRVGFHMRNVVDEDLIQLLEDRVKLRKVFDKQMYLGGNRTLLSEDSYALNRTLIQTREILTKYYYREFYSPDLGTVVNPDGVYDPYLVNFLNDLVSFADVKVRLAQLYPNVDATYRWSIWSRLMTNYNLGLVDLCSLYQVQYKHNTWADIGVTALINRRYLLLRPDLIGVDEEDIPEIVRDDYVVTASFYTDNPDGITDFEAIVREAITTRKIADIDAFITDYVDVYYLESRADQFYKIPLMIRLIDIARATLSPNIR